MFKFFSHQHKWRTVAIDVSVTWHYKADPSNEYPHILLFQICDECGERRLDYDDPTEQGKSYAMHGSNTVAKLRSKWIHGGIINAPADDRKIEWLDPSFAPLRGFEKWVKAFKRDPKMKELLENHQMVDDALGQLEVAIKLCSPPPKN